MKVGDLVTLSAYGKKIKRTGWIQAGDIGVVKRVKKTTYWSEYEIMWNRSLWHQRLGLDLSHCHFLDRKDLKFVK